MFVGFADNTDLLLLPFTSEGKENPDGCIVPETDRIKIKRKIYEKRRRERSRKNTMHVFFKLTSSLPP